MTEIYFLAGDAVRGAPPHAATASTVGLDGGRTRQKRVS